MALAQCCCSNFQGNCSTLRKITLRIGQHFASRLAVKSDMANKISDAIVLIFTHIFVLAPLAPF